VIAAGFGVGGTGETTEAAGEAGGGFASFLASAALF